MGTIKTVPNDASVDDFIETTTSNSKRSDTLTLLEMFMRITGEKPRLWGSSLIGFGTYHYKSERSTQEGDWPLTAFSPRKQNLTLYFMLGFDNYQDLLKVLGKHKTSVGCLYINKLSDVDLKVLEQLIERSYFDMKVKYS